MKISPILAALAGLLAQAPGAYAAPACPDLVTAAVAKSAGIANGHAAAVSAACKPWPHDPATLLAAFAFDTGTPDVKEVVVATVDAATHRVRASYRQEVGEDAAIGFGDGSLAIDSAPYQLTPQVRAFGIRFTSAARGASCPDALWRDELTLFVADGAELRPVLEGLAMTRMVARKGCIGNATPDAVVDKANLSIGLARTGSHGYADLVVSARITRAGGAAKTGIERYTLRYDGDAYRAGKQAPWWLLLFPLGG